MATFLYKDESNQSNNLVSKTMTNLPNLKIGNLEAKFPIIQGGMGVGVSLSGLSSAVANEGGIGIIASVGIGLLKGLLKDYSGSYIEANKAALRDEIKAAKKMSDGIIGVNIMHALTDYDSLVKTAVEEDIDIIISGAGIPRDLPNYIGNKNIKLIPIVSSARYAKLIQKAWEKIGHSPDAFIVEGPEAGGHLGFKYEDLIDGTTQSLEEITREVVDFTNCLDNPVPVIAAGGIYSGQDIKKALSWGASGVQMATRFVPTLECDADDKFKQMYLGAKKEDIILIKSPVGMPGRAIENSFLENIQKGEKSKFGCGYKCLKTCDPKNSPYCIANALVNAQKGNLDEGFVFAGAKAYKCTPETYLDKDGKFITVNSLMKRLAEEYNS